MILIAGRCRAIILLFSRARIEEPPATNPIQGPDRLIGLVYHAAAYAKPYRIAASRRYDWLALSNYHNWLFDFAVATAQFPFTRKALEEFVDSRSRS
jgi:hypothetical protein